MALFKDVSNLCIEGDENVEAQAVTSMITSLLDVFHGILKYISDVVRRALAVSAVTRVYIQMCALLKR